MMMTKHKRSMDHDSESSLWDTVAIVPACNEQDGLLAGLRSLANQTHRPDLIVVVVNNSADDTERIAYAFADDPTSPVTYVITMEENHYKKAGALNAGIAYAQYVCTRHLREAARYVLVMDADTELHPEFIKRARRVMQGHEDLGGVSAACFGRQIKPRSLWQRYLLGMQRIEYGRYAHSRVMRNVHTMSGAGSFYRTSALQGLLKWRGEVFLQDHRNLVEDYETTLALKESGWKITANQMCVAYTDLMPTLRGLIKQRERWVRGTVDTLRGRGITRHTWLSIMSIMIGVLGIAYTAAWFSMSAHSVMMHGFHLAPIYLSLIAFWSVYQTFTVRHLGWRSMLVEALVVPEMVFNLVRNYWLVSSVIKSYVTRNQSLNWD